MRIAYFDCFSGASGDMLLGALLDAGLDLADLRADLACLPVGGYELAAPKVTRRGLTGTHLRVVTRHAETGHCHPHEHSKESVHSPHRETEEEAQPARTWPDIQRTIRGSSLPDKVQQRSLAVLRRLAEVESTIHGIPLEEIHFHEIGAADTLVDVVGFVCGLERLGIEAVYCSPLPLGGGTIETEHGRLPVPAPATLALLAQVHAPTLPGPVQAELVTPTGAALLAELAIFSQPAMTVQAVGYGFGSQEFDFPNVTRVWLGEALAPTSSPEADQVVELACNLDDAPGQLLGYALERLLAAGALDVWFTPIQMKKNRPAVQLSVLARPEDAEGLARLLLTETPTLGVRWHLWSRIKAGREVREVTTPWGRVRVKIKLWQGKTEAIAPEYDDCARLAAGHGVPLHEVVDAARQAAMATDAAERPALQQRE
ncbi:MAG: nickel pincer cofactor biosynthesis protein LarC [Anaerolineae bacterium]